MDRTDELLRATQLFQSIDRSKSAVKTPELSLFIQRASRVSSCLDGNETLVRRMNKLIERKEFSNDPTAEMQEISTSFEGNVGAINKDLAYLKKDCEAYGQGNDTQQHRKLILQFLQKLLSGHINAFKEAVKVHSANVEQRNKRIGGKYGQINAQSAISSDTASKYALFSSTSASTGEGIAVQRQQGLRNRYGGPTSQSSYTPTIAVADTSTDNTNTAAPMDTITNTNTHSTAAPVSGGGPTGTNTVEDDYENDKKYGKSGPQRAAVSQQNNNSRPPSSSTTNNSYGSGARGYGNFNTGATPGSGITHRAGASSVNSTHTGANNTAGISSVGGGGQVQQQRGTYDRYRLRQAEQAESTIAQMGQLFAQMATLVSEQSETIMRIEDDVEIGYQETQQAQGHLQTVYDITKGNRSLILKIFALLVVFIFLFLYWT